MTHEQLTEGQVSRAAHLSPQRIPGPAAHQAQLRGCRSVLPEKHHACAHYQAALASSSLERWSSLPTSLFGCSAREELANSAAVEPCIDKSYCRACKEGEGSALERCTVQQPRPQAPAHKETKAISTAQAETFRSIDMIAGKILLVPSVLQMKQKTVTDPGPRPSSAPRACGQFGVRAPVRYGRKLTPPQPGGSRFASSVSSWWLMEKAWQTCSKNWETDCGMRHLLETALKFSWIPTHISGRFSYLCRPAGNIQRGKFHLQRSRSRQKHPPSSWITHLLCDAGAVLEAAQRQPLAGRVAEGRHCATAVEHRDVRRAKQRACG